MKNLAELKNNEHKTIHRNRLILLLAVILVGVIFIFSVSFQQIVLKYIQSIERYFEDNQLLGAAVFIILAAFSAMFSFFSSVPLIPIAVMAFGKNASIALLILGWMLGDVGAYFLGYSLGYNLASRYIPLGKIRYYEKKLSKRTEFWLVFIFRYAVPSEIAGYTLGILRYDFLRYFIITFLAEFPFAVIYIYSGDALVRKNLFIFTALIFLSAAIIALMSYVFGKYISSNSSKSDG